MSGASWQIKYGDGSSASGDVFKDVVDVGGVTAPRQAVEAAEDISQQFVKDRDNDGLMGLAFSKINTGLSSPCRTGNIILTSLTVKPQPQSTFFDSVKEQLDTPLFAVTLKHDKPGSYDFGFVDKEKYQGSLEYVDVDNSKGFWMFSASGYGVGDSAPNSNGIDGIAGSSSPQ